MANVLLDNNSVVHYAAVPSNYSTTGQSLGQDMFENVDRLQNVAIGSFIDTIIYSVGVREIEGNGIIEYAIFKVERAHEVPTANAVLLPTDAIITSSGLQAGMRQFQPGRIIKFGQVAVAQEQPRQLSLKGNYKKFRFSKVRAGDYYGIILFVRGLTCTIDFQSRYQSYN